VREINQLRSCHRFFATTFVYTNSYTPPFLFIKLQYSQIRRSTDVNEFKAKLIKKSTRPELAGLFPLFLGLILVTSL